MKDPRLAWLSPLLLLLRAVGLLGLQLDLILLPLDQLVEPEFFKLLSIVPQDGLIDPLKRALDVTLHVLPEGLLLADLLQHRVKPVLNLVLCAAYDLLRDLGPLVPDLFLSLEKEKVFLSSPWLPLDVWGKEVDPPFSALLALSLGIAHPSVDLVCNFLPLLLPSFIHKQPEEVILLISPRGLLWLLLVLRLPLVVTLVVVAPRDQPRYVLPVVHCL